jgi:hypothetical protein
MRKSQLGTHKLLSDETYHKLRISASVLETPDERGRQRGQGRLKVRRSFAKTGEQCPESHHTGSMGIALGGVCSSEPVADSGQSQDFTMKEGQAGRLRLCGQAGRSSRS